MEDVAIFRKRKVEIEITPLESNTIATAIELYLLNVKGFMPTTRTRRYRAIMNWFRNIGEQY